MTAGIPGTGIGGIFYLISAFAMPFVEIIKTLRGRSSIRRWIAVVRQLTMASAILASMWMLGLALGYLLETQATFDVVRVVQGHIAVHLQNIAKVNIFNWVPLLMSTTTLLIVLSFTQMMRVVFRPESSN